jgi:predicted dehydrogenase/nucleoside-diphosphate-sugar epimerase
VPKPFESRAQVAIIGAGFIAEVHAEVLRRKGRQDVVAVVDPNRARAEALAARWAIPTVLDTIEALGGDVPVDVAHVLVPPPLHRAVAEPLLLRGIDVLLEKPMAETVDDCEALQRAAAATGAALMVNLNFVHHPAFVRLHREASSGAIGPLRHVVLEYLVPLRQLEAGQLGHWMFASPTNLLLEQAVHPLSQLDRLLGPLIVDAVVPSRPREVLPGVDLVTDWQIAGRGSVGTFGLRIGLGVSTPKWQLRCFGSDGILEADMFRATVLAERPTRWLDAVDQCTTGISLAWQRARLSFTGLAAYGFAQLGLRGRSDGFFRSMQDSVHEFYAGRPTRAGRPDRRPRDLVELCTAVGAATPTGRPRPVVRMVDRDAWRADVLLLGGTGLLGRHLVDALLAEGLRVAVMARQPRGLATSFADPGVVVLTGDVNDRAAVGPAVRRANVVVHLAPGSGSNWAEVEQRMVGSARLVAECCLEADRPLLFTSSIAALYLGDPAAIATAATQPDPLPLQRADYARGKIESERVLRRYVTDHGLRLGIVRPGVVLGRGTSPFHSGIGLFNRETHCLGWNDGRNALPLILAGDVAAAMTRLCTGGGGLMPVANLVGEVRPNARAYIRALAEATSRPLRYHPQRPALTALVEAGKWSLKRLAGRRVPRTTLRDLRSRGLLTPFDTSLERSELNWCPESDQERFFVRAFAGAAA